MDNTPNQLDPCRAKLAPTRSFDLDIRDGGPLLREVFLLGAGFSIAISGQMPTTTELREACNARLSATALAWLAQRGLGQVQDFEVVLSELAAPQPYLDESTNQHNRAVFTEYSKALHEAISMFEAKALQGSCPPWLAQLVTTAHFQRSTLVTFNYDTLIESVARGEDAALVAAGNTGALETAHWSELIKDQPPLPPGPSRLGAAPVSTLQLLKLHGSTNWYWTPGDVSGSTLNRTPDVGSFGHPRTYTDDEREHQLPGRVPFIIPPTAIKSSYYGLPLTKELWTRAHRALTEASRITVIGYSFPPTDLTTLGLLRSALREDHEVQVVNPDGEAVAARLRGSGIRAAALFVGDGAVERFVDHWVKDVSTTIAAQIQQRGLLDLPLAVSWNADAFAAVMEIQVRNGALVLCTEAPTSGIEAIQRSRGDDQPHPVDGRALMTEAEKSASLPVYAVNDSNCRPVVGVSIFHKDLLIGYEPLWAVLHLASVDTSQP